MTGNVIDIGDRGPRHVDWELTAKVQGVRAKLGVSYDDNSVIDQPLLENHYRPYVMTSGAIRLTRDGLEDFGRTFGRIEGLDVPALLVVYETVRKGLEKKRVDDDQFHQKLGEIVIAGRNRGIFSGQGTVHHGEDRLIGFSARWIASHLAASEIAPQGARLRAPAQIASSALGALSHTRANTDRREVMGHFSLMMPDFITDRLFRII